MTYKHALIVTCVAMWPVHNLKIHMEPVYTAPYTAQKGEDSIQGRRVCRSWNALH